MKAQTETMISMPYDLHCAQNVSQQRILRAQQKGGWGIASGRTSSTMAFGSGHCPGRTPPFWAVKRPARPHKSAMENRFAQENAQGA